MSDMQHHTTPVRLALRYVRDPAVAEEVAAAALAGGNSPLTRTALCPLIALTTLTSAPVRLVHLRSRSVSCAPSLWRLSTAQ